MCGWGFVYLPSLLYHPIFFVYILAWIPISFYMFNSCFWTFDCPSQEIRIVRCKARQNRSIVCISYLLKLYEGIGGIYLLANSIYTREIFGATAI